MRELTYKSKQNLMRYGIREIVDLTQRISELDPDFQFIRENIGDPVAKGWGSPGFVKDILTELIRSNDSNVFGYTHSRGRIATRKWVVDYAKRFSPSIRLDYEHVIFSSGLGAGLSTFYRMLTPHMRVIQPNPGYPAHISNECFSAGAESIGYLLDPENQWQPDVDHMERQIKRHPGIVGILLINPNNPTGSVYTSEMLETITRIAERYHLMLISDEVYFRLVFNGCKYVHISELASGRVPLVVMRGISKDVPWPGARCGWLEFHNTDLDHDFELFFQSIIKSQMIEVCSTTMPQTALPLIYDHPEYVQWLKQYNAELENNSNTIAEIMGGTQGITIHPIQGAFYMTVLFDANSLNDRQSLPIANPRTQQFITRAVSNPGMPLDKRFAYYLLASTGICIVPASDFDCPYPGFRITALERNTERRDWICKKLSEVITQYLSSA